MGCLLVGPAALALERGAEDESAPLRLLATANIFGAGYDAPPAPGDGGAGTLPPGWRLPAGSNRVVTFPRITGTVTPIAGSRPANGPHGDGVGPTDVQSWQGISGIVHGRNGMFVAGVFLGDSRPALPAPARLDFTEGKSFDAIAPMLGQTFFVGGGTERRFVVPEAATRLYLGFADAFLGVGAPGWYGNNHGTLDVVATGVLDGQSLRLDTTAPVLSGAANTTVKVRRKQTQARVTYFVGAHDGVDGDVAVRCTRPSGSLFKLGRTAVDCSASDTSGNTVNARFIVIVKRAQ